MYAKIHTLIEVVPGKTHDNPLLLFTGYICMQSQPP